MMAPFKGNKWIFEGGEIITVAGQFVTSIKSLVDACGKGISTQNVRTSLVKFEKFNFLTNRSTNKSRMISIVNWDTYQADERLINKQPNKQLTSNQQATNKQLTTIEEGKKERKKEKSIKKADIDLKKEDIYRKVQSLFLTKQEFNKLISEGYKQEDIDDTLDRMENFAKLNKYKSALMTCRNWLKSSVKKGMISLNNSSGSDKMPTSKEQITPELMAWMQEIKGSKVKFAKRYGKKEIDVPFEIQNILNEIHQKELDRMYG
jgi:hypothetical protein